MSGDTHDELAARGRDAVKAVIDEMARLRAEVKRLDMMNKVEAGVRARAQTDVELQRVQLKNNAAQHRAEVERLTRERDAWAFSAMTGRWRELLHIEPNYDDNNEWGESVKMRAAFDALKEEASP